MDLKALHTISYGLYVIGSRKRGRFNGQIANTVFQITADVLSNKECMTYAYYHQVKRGSTPKTAPIYIEEQKVSVVKAAKYKCSVCGYIYDPALGDPDGSIKPGTPFEELPDDWVCPICGAAKSEFEKIE